MNKQTEIKAEPKKLLPSLGVNESGMVIGRNIDEQFRIAGMFRQSGMLPERYKTTEMVLTAMQLCYELNLKPLTSMRQIAVIRGTPSMYGDLPLSLVQASGKLENFREYFVAKDGKEICTKNENLNAEVYAAVCIIKRIGMPEQEVFFSMDDARTANLLGSSDTWKKYLKRMLKFRCRGQALKDNFADVLNGVSIAEYDHHVGAEEIETMQPSQPASSGASMLNAAAKATAIETTATPLQQDSVTATAKEPDAIIEPVQAIEPGAKETQGEGIQTGMFDDHDGIALK